MWDAVHISGLTRLGVLSFSYRHDQIALSGLGRLTDPAVNGTFHYDDTAWGAVPAGLFKTLASCAVQSGAIYGRYVQLLLAAVPQLGDDLTGALSGTNGGSITSFTASMGARGSLVLAETNQSASANALVTFGSALPWAMPPHAAPALALMRPTSLSWPGQDANEAVGTIWDVSEVGVCDFDFSVMSQSADVQMDFIVVGFA